MTQANPDTTTAVSLTDLVSVGVLTSRISGDDIDQVIATHGLAPKRRGGTLPARVMFYYLTAMAVFADEDYEGVMRRLAGPLQTMPGCWDPDWELPTSGGITRARTRIGVEPVKDLFEATAAPVASMQTRAAFVAGKRMVSWDGMVFDLPDTDTNRAEFGTASGGTYPQARVVTLTESASHVSLGAVVSGVAGKGTGERAAAEQLCGLLDEEMMLIADSGFYGFRLWCHAADTGAELLWRIGDITDLPVVASCGDGSYTTLLFAPTASKTVRARLLDRARAGEDLSGETDRARWARVIEYTVGAKGDERGSGDLICLLSTVLDPVRAPAMMLAAAYHHRWQHETANREIKNTLRGPGKILRSQSPDMVRQEIYGYLLAHNAISGLICEAATDNGIDPHRVKFTATVRIVREHLADPDAFSP